MSFMEKLKNRKHKLIVIIGVIIFCLAFGGVGITKYVNASQVKNELVLGNKYLEDGKYQEAILEFQKAIKVEPKNIEARVGLAKAYQKTGKLDEAEKILKEAISINPRKVDPYLELGKLYINENNLVDAFKVLNDGYKITNNQSIKSMLDDLKSKITVENVNETIILGESYSLPNEVTVKINNSEGQFPVKWDKTTVDVSEAGTQTVTGTLENTDKTVTLTLNVVAIASIEDINNTIKQNDKYSLPSKVTAKMTDNSTQEVEVTWNPPAVDSSKAGTYTYQGIVSGYSGKVKLTLNVSKLYSRGEEIQVYNRLLSDTNWQRGNGIIFSDGKSTIDEHYIVDIDQDGVYELLLHHGSCDADMTVSVVTYNNGDIKIQHLSSGHGGYMGYSSSKKVFFLSGIQMGYRYILGYKLENNICRQVYSCDDTVGAYGEENATYSVNEQAVSKEEYDKSLTAFGNIVK